MYAKFFAIAAFVSVAVAGGAPGNNVSQCNTGPVQCCNQVQNSDHHEVKTRVSKVGGLLGLDVDDILNGLTGQAGLDCNPISVIGTDGNSCSAQPVCCSNNNFNGLVALGCTPVNVNV